MRTYAAISLLTRTDAEAFRLVRYPNALISFHYHDETDDLISRLGYPVESVLVDSGAFTVWTRGATIDLDAYIAWCLEQREILPDFRAINLDVIPGTPDGDPPTMIEQAKAADDSVENADRMRAAGINVMEVFHWHEPLDYLDELLERRQHGEVLGIGGLAGNGSITDKQRFCAQVFRRVLANYDRAVLPPLHGLGISHDSRLAPQFPWWSIDSSSWSSGVRFGRFVTPRGRKTNRPDPRTANRRVRQHYIGRVLNGWIQDDVDLSRIWAARGVMFAR